MKNILMLMLFYSVVTCSAQKVSTEFIDKWKNAKEYTIKMADAMPDTLYDFKPSESEMTFSEQLKHLNENLLWLHEDFILPNIKSKSGDLRRLLKDAKTKSEIKSVLSKSFDFIILELNNIKDGYLEEGVSLFGNQKTRRQVCLLAIDHLSHHRGQCVVYLRINGITPPKYLGY